MDTSVQKKLRVAGTSCVLFFIALFLTAYSATNKKVARAGSTLIAEVHRPMQLANEAVVNFFGNFWNDYLDLIHVKEENASLQDRIRILENDVTRLGELDSENMNLRRILDLKDSASISGQVARVIGYEASSWVQAVTVNRGYQQGIQIGMPVVEGGGVVGQVIAVASNSSRVLLITDPASGADALIQRNRARGVLVGAGQRRAVLRYLLREHEVLKGDRVVTSGLDGVYPKGLTLGVVVRVKQESLFHVISVRPKVDFSKLEVVLIVTGHGEAQSASQVEERGSP